VELLEVAGVPVFEIVPAGAEAVPHQLIHFEIHGGGLVFGAGDACRDMGILSADRFGLRTLSLDYRMPPEHPYPAALDDCLAVYRTLLESHEPKDIVVSGGSAGGNLAAALMLRARDEGLPLPAAVFLFTPEVDLTESGDSFQTNLGIDNVLTQSLAPMNALYAAGQDLTQPYISPLFGDFSKGFPPTFLQTGTRDLFLSNTVRMHRRLREAGIDAELHVFEAMPHGGFSGAPEDEQLDAEVRRFLSKLWT
jgi:epsilon-lactone hydrolase